MRGKLFSVLLSSVLLILPFLLPAAIPASERAALIALYNATDGDNWDHWYYNSWKQEPLEADGFSAVGTEGNWIGVTVNDDHVTEIILGYSDLKGYIPPELGNLTQLTNLSLAMNSLSGSIPPELGNLTQLVYLFLYKNSLSGSIPSELGNLNQITQFDLSKNSLSGSIPPELGNLTHNVNLNLSTNSLSGSIPPELGNLTQMHHLDLSENSLSGSIPPELGNLTQMVVLLLSDNCLSGSIPPEISNLPNLRWLKLQNNSLSGSIPPELGNKLDWLSLSDNCLSGSIPPEIGNLPYLLYLDLQNNSLSGSIPPELGNLTKLHEINLYSNSLSGGIPPEICNLVENLDVLNLSNNSLSGNLPPELGNITYLRKLGLSSNSLSGSIPPELGNLTRLEHLKLDSNALSGNIPTSLTHLKLIVSISIDYNALYTNDETLHAFLDEYDVSLYDWDNTQTVAPLNVSTVTITRTSIELTWSPISFVSKDGGYLIYYSTTAGGPWTYAGITGDKSADTYTLTGLTPGTTYYIIIKTTTAPHDENENRITSENSEETSATTIAVPTGQDQAPIGTVDSPIESNTPYSGSVIVSGWALDDVEVLNVKIYNVVGNTKTYIGDAVFVDGARPDVAALYTDYPNYNRAGWGYMMLSNFLPNQGNGTYTIQAIATDYLNHQTILGSKTITCNNANAIKPFGAMDTPPQGGMVSGTMVHNFGWALTPQPNKIPEDGSTILVWIDGLPIGHPRYNIYRNDIATLFPGYQNSKGAVGYFGFDSTAYEDGVHTIAWSVRDDAGNTEGIGSRYFTIQNTGGADRRSSRATTSFQRRTAPPRNLGTRVVNDDTAVIFKKGYGTGSQQETVYPTEMEASPIQCRPMQRIQINLNFNSSAKPLPIESKQLNEKEEVKEGVEETGMSKPVPGMRRNRPYSGYLRVGDGLQQLPTGSTLDSVNGVFYWQPGPGFAGRYRLLFLQETGTNQINRKEVVVEIK